MKNLKELEQKYLELGKEIEILKKHSEKEEFTYPIYCRSKISNHVVKFNSLNEGVYVMQSMLAKSGTKSLGLTSHTETEYWENLDVCEKTGFFDGQLVWCWDNNDTHMRYLKFYDVKNKCTYNYSGIKCGSNYSNYEPFEGNYPNWALEAFQTLER